MDNSSTIGYALIAGFIVYITVRGELPAYLCIVGLGTGCPTPNVDVPANANTPHQPINTTSVITAPSNGAGTTPVYSTIGSGGNTEQIPTTYPFPPGWTLPELPAPTFPGGRGGTQTSTTFFCEDPFGNPIDCADQVDYGLCYNDQGSLVSCD